MSPRPALFILALTTLVATVASDNALCPPCTCRCCFMAIPDVCDRYCFCSATSSNYSSELTCSEGESFDPSLAMCLGKEDFDCKVSIPTSGVNCSQHVEGLYAYPKKCGLFVQCANGLEFVHTCPKGLQFSTQLQRCEHPENAECPSDTVKGKPCEHDRLYPDEADCSRFYHCSMGKLEPRVCPRGLHWCRDCSEPRCEAPYVAKCRSKLTTAFSLSAVTENRVRVSSSSFRQSPSDDSSSGELLECPIPDGVYSVPADPSLYLHCHGAQGAFFRCPKDQVFNQDLNSCVNNHPVEPPVLMSEGRCQDFTHFYFRR